MKPFRLSVLVALALALPAVHAATTIFAHTFDEGAGSLNTTPVDTGTGSWVAADVVTANGVFSTGPGSATLAFTPDQGTQYQLDATIVGVTGDGNWVALGFAGGPGLAGAGTPGQSTVSDNNARFTSQAGVDVEGRAWMMARGTNTTTFNRAFTEGSSGSVTDWAGPTSLTQSDGGDFDLRILLDTTGGAGTWTATWLAKRPTDGTFTEVRSAFLLPNEDITSVGFAFSTGATDGTLQSFSLTQIPEPSAALLGSLGLLVVLRRRR